MPLPVVNVLYSCHWPLHIASSVIVIFFWLELASESNIQTAGGFLTTNRWPAALAICIVAAVEYTTSALRALGSSSVLLYITACVDLVEHSTRVFTHFTLSRAVYCLILLVCAATYFYVYYTVRRFFAGLPTMSAKHHIIRKVSLRLFLGAFSFIVLVILGALSAVRVYYEAVGQSVIQFFIFLTINAGSSLTIAAFQEKLGAKDSKSAKNASATASLGTLSARSASGSLESPR